MERMKSAALASPPHTVTHTGQVPAVNPTGAVANSPASIPSCSSHRTTSFACTAAHAPAPLSRLESRA